VIQVLEKARVPIDLVVGTSAGALVGSLYCAYQNSADVRERLAGFASSPQFKDDKFADLVAMTPPPGSDQGFVQTARRFYKLGLFFATTLFQKSFIDTKQFEHDIAGVVPEANIENLPLPLAIVATDLEHGKEVVLTKGPLRSAVMASSAIAGVFPPVEIDGMELVDGGFANLIPVEVAFRMGADVVIAVDVSSNISDSQDFSRTGSAISLRAAAIQAETAKNLQARFADVLIRPAVSDIHWAQFALYDTIIPRGRAAANAVLPQIKKAIARARLRKPFWAVFGRKWTVDFRRKP
jgi:NTE family protein